MKETATESSPGRRPSAKRIMSAGGVVLRRDPDGDVEVLACHRSGDQLWALPKGTPEDGETVEETAVREVMEETGLQVRLDAKVGESRYSFYRNGRRHDKTVYFYLMFPTGGDISLHDAEFDRVEWMDVPLARERLTYLNDARIVETAVSLAEERGLI
ncbi:MAG: NUDIX hydrolase [Chloroflexota bacterium]